MTPPEIGADDPPILVVGSDPIEVSMVVAILAELGRSVRSIRPGVTDGDHPDRSVAIVVALDRDPEAGAWARARHRARPGDGLVAVMDVIDGITASAALAVGARAVVALPPSVEAIRRAVADVEDWIDRLDAVGSGRTGTSGADSLVVVGSKGGAGATTVVIEVASRLAGTVAILDLGEPIGSVADRFGVSTQLELGELARTASGVPSRRISDAATALPIEPVLFGGMPGTVDGAALRRLIEIIAGEFDHVVVDGGRGLSIQAETAIRVADQVLVVVTPDVASIRGAQGLFDRWERSGVRRPVACSVVVNRSRRGGDLGRQVVARSLPAPLLAAEIPADFRRLEPLVNGAADGPVDGPIGRAFDRLTREVGIGSGPDRPRVRRGTAAPERSQRRRSRVVPRPRRGDVGQSTVEVVVAIAVVLMALVAVVHLVGDARTSSMIHRAASQGARAAALRAGEPGARPDDIRHAAASAAEAECAPTACTSDVTVGERSITVEVHLPAPRVHRGAGAVPVTTSTTASVTVRRR